MPLSFPGESRAHVYLHESACLRNLLSILHACAYTLHMLSMLVMKLGQC